MDLKTFMCNIPVFVISLPDFSERRNTVLREFGSYNFSFIEAVDGRKENFKSNYDVKYTSSYNFTDATIAVICSHAKAIKMAFDAGLERVCIFEDDVHTTLIKTCNFTLDEICNLSDDWEIIQLLHTGELNLIDKTYNDYINNGLRLLKRDVRYFGTGFIINRKGMEKFLNEVVNVNDTYNSFNIKQNVIDVEHIIIEQLNSYILNRQVFLFWCFNI